MLRTVRRDSNIELVLSTAYVDQHQNLTPVCVITCMLAVMAAGLVPA